MAPSSASGGRVALAFLCTAVVVVAARGQLRPREPVYQGKLLSFWLGGDFPGHAELELDSGTGVEPANAAVSYRTLLLLAEAKEAANAAENVSFDIRDSAETSKKLYSIQAQFARSGVDGPVELRNVSFCFPSEITPRLQAKIIRLRADGIWHVLDGVVADREGRTHFIDATLQPAG